MKKITTLMIVMSIAFFSYAQPVADNAIIPVSVSLNSILRLNVTSGGNIDFQVNTLTQYTNGIINSDRYDTKFTIASSIDFDVEMYSESATLVGSDNALAANTMTLNNIGYIITETGSGTAPADWVLPTGLQLLNNTSTTEIVSGVANHSAGGIDKNAFTINWELCTPAVLGAAGAPTSNLLGQSLVADRYSANVFLVLRARN